MSGSVWVPALVALAIGLGAGAVAAWRLRRRAAKPSEARGIALEVADLEARRDDLYHRLRSEEAADPEERRALETSAARVLRELEERRGRLEGASEGKRPAASAAPAAASDAPAPTPRDGGFASRHPLLVGFLSGASMVALVGILIYWAGRDAGPRPPESGAAGAPSGALPADHPPTDEVPPELAARIAEVEAQLAAAPDDLGALKELALLELSSGDFLAAFNAAGEILLRQPEDPDGLFVQGVVRVSMGQSEAAIDLLDRVLARFPEHLQAMVYRGIALFQLGEIERATDTWEMALDQAGGRSPQIERLLAEARGASAAPPAAGGPAATSPASPPAAPPAGPPAAPRAAPSGDHAAAFHATLELAPGAEPPAGAVLFVFLRPAGGGPPVAARRIDRASFPFEVTLDANDSMMGAELPEEGELTARIDADGSASTRDPGDLAATTSARRGEPVRLVLAPE